jgi:hypothetical protein
MMLYLRSWHRILLVAVILVVARSGIPTGYAQGTPRPYATPWISDGGQLGASHGLAVSSAGDVNGDGYDDVVIGAPFYDGAAPDTGRFSLYLGSYHGLPAQPSLVIEGSFPDGWFGFSVSSAGDVNGDGFYDLLVGAPQEPSAGAPGGAGSYDGRVYLFLGSATGLVTTPAWISESPVQNGWYGYAVSLVGDRDGDGFSDIGIGAPLLGDAVSSGGKVFIFHGSAAGLSIAPYEIIPPPAVATHAERFGISLAHGGDTNGDGLSELVIGCSRCEHGELQEGMAFVYGGGSTPGGGALLWYAEGNQAGAGLGISVAGVGDVNGDHFADLLIGAPYYDGASMDGGRVVLYFGSASGFSASSRWLRDGSIPNGYLGYSVSAVGDLNGDSFADVAVGATLYSGAFSSEGALYALYGSGNGPVWSTRWAAFGSQDDAFLTASLAGAGDINGDGLPEIIVGASGYDNNLEDEGRAIVYLMRENPAVPPSPSPSPSPTPTVPATPSQSPSPTPTPTHVPTAPPEPTVSPTVTPTATPRSTPVETPTPEPESSIPLRVVLRVDGRPTSGVPLTLGELVFETNAEGEVVVVLNPTDLVSIRSGSGEILFRPLIGRADDLAAHNPLYIDASRLGDECERMSDAVTTSPFAAANATIFSLTKESLRLKARGIWKPKGDFRGPFFLRGEVALARIAEITRSLKGARISCSRTTTTCATQQVRKDELRAAFESIFFGRAPAGLAKLQRRRKVESQRFSAVVDKLPDSYIRCDDGG